ncbi:response regulator [Vibrio vulnificus]|nr:response regulator [Vibrio vulnificus]EJN6713310.1 response regulator [Vibrio vulnificus]MCU8269136.1 response regulator [Vibrio vulnificus]
MKNVLRDLSVLLVESSKMQSSIVINQLSMAGVVDIECVDSIFAAKKSLSHFTPELIISSMYLQDGCCIELIEYTQTLAERIAFVLISSEQKPELLNQVRAAGAVAILNKPFKFEELENALNLALPNCSCNNGFCRMVWN